MPSRPSPVEERLAQASRLWLFLDYDGTLADFAATPAHVEPNKEVVSLLRTLAADERIRLAVVSGRRLRDLEKLVPLEDIVLAGTYGVEMRTAEGETLHRQAFAILRPYLETLKSDWARLIVAREQFHLEDKGWALALHARFAPDDIAQRVLDEAKALAERTVCMAPLRVLGGHKFLEVAPRIADKRLTVEYLLAEHPWSGALPLYLGDDDKDETAFGAVQSHGGIALVVGDSGRQTVADDRLDSPPAARQWLQRLPALLKENGE